MVDIDDIIADEEGTSENRNIGKTKDYGDYRDLDNFFEGENVVDKPNSDELNKEDTGSLVYIGKVTHYYQKAKVIAIELSCDIALEDRIIIADPNGEVRMAVESMQIDRKNVNLASSGDSIGIKVASQITLGSRVYKDSLQNKSEF